MPWGGWPDPRRDEDDWYPEEWFHDHYTNGDNQNSAPRSKDRNARRRSYDEGSLGLEGKLRMRVDKRPPMDEEKESS